MWKRMLINLSKFVITKQIFFLNTEEKHKITKKEFQNNCV